MLREGPPNPGILCLCTSYGGGSTVYNYRTIMGTGALRAYQLCSDTLPGPLPIIGLQTAHPRYCSKNLIISTNRRRGFHLWLLLLLKYDSKYVQYLGTCIVLLESSPTSFGYRVEQLSIPQPILFVNSVWSITWQSLKCKIKLKGLLKKCAYVLI